VNEITITIAAGLCSAAILFLIYALDTRA